MRPDLFDDDDGDDTDLDLMVVLPLSNRQMGTASEREAIAAMQDELDELLREAGVGEFDGDEIGGGECTLFFCGPDIDKLLAVLRPQLKRSPLCRGADLVRMVADEAGELSPRREPV
jgi:hypothetical protein